MKIVAQTTRAYKNRIGITTIRWVAVVDDKGYQIVYVGEGPPEWVMRCGDPLYYEEACQMFSGLKKEKYRLKLKRKEH